MLSYKDINWINVEINGSRADVYMHELKAGKDNGLEPTVPCNIVASRTGVITQTDVQSGKLLYKQGSGVSEGSVIVSGAVSSGDTVIYVHSDAEIIAEFYDEPEFSMEFTTVERVPTGESFAEKQLMVLGMVFPLGGDSDHTDTVCTEQTEQCSLWGLELPVRIKTETYTKYKEITVTRKLDDVIKLLEQQLELYKFNFLKEYEILDTQTELETTETGVTLRASVKLRGDIGVKQPIYEH